MNTTAKGLAAESQAAAYLQAKGYTLLARNFRTPHGEVDLILQHKKTLVFVEVKQRASVAFGGPVAAVTRAHSVWIPTCLWLCPKLTPRTR